MAIETVLTRFLEGSQYRVQAMGTAPPMLVWGGPLKGVQAQLLAGGVNVSVPGSSALLQSERLVLGEPPLPSGAGYTSNHADHAACTAYYKSRALMVHNGHTGSVDIRLVEQAGTKMKLLWVGCNLITHDTNLSHRQDISVKTADVPVNIGSEELLRFSYRYALAGYNEHMRLEQNRNPRHPYVPLLVEDLTLCNNYGVPYDMRLTKDTIASYFFKDWSAKGARGQFKDKVQPLVIQLVVRFLWIPVKQD